MSRISEIVSQLNNLPKGYFSYKKINNKEYCYLQYKEMGKIVSKYIPDDLIEKTRIELIYRKELEDELNELLTNGSSIPVLTTRVKELTGYLMMSDIPVASFDHGNIESIDKKLAPLFIVRTHNLEEFLKLRCIDNTRVNSRLLKKVLGIHTSNNKEISLHAYGATITDNYWFKAKGSKLKFKDISFNSDIYSELALSGEVIVFPKKPLLTPEITTPGSFEKCWKLIDKKWWLFKKENKKEIFSELFVSKLAKKLNIDTADYFYEDGFIKTRNFAEKYNFEPMVSIAGEDDSYENVFQALEKFSLSIQKDYMKLMYLDCLVKNVDRHNENMGILRDKKTGKIISLAPNFDNNISLLSSNSVLNDDPSKDGFISLFNKFLKKKESARSIYKSLKLTKITEKMLKEILNDIEIKEDESLIIKFIMSRYQYLSLMQRNI